MTKKKRKKIPRVVAVDFDGCLCFSDYPFIKGPNQKIIDFVKREREAGSLIVLWTCRNGRQLMYALEWCAEQGIEFDAINDNVQQVKDVYGDESRKIYADLYIDDRSVHPGDIFMED